MDIISQLIDYQLEHILTIILLYLDPASLHSIKQVCKSWHEVVRETIWGRQFVRRLVQEANLERWKNGSFEERRFQTFSGPDVSIYSLCCDAYIVIAGMSNGLAKVFDIRTGSFKYLLNCRKTFDITEECCSGVRVAIGDQIIVCGSADGVLGVWDKQSFLPVYKSSKKKERIMGVKIVMDMIFAMYNDRVQVIKNNICGVEMVAKLGEFGTGALTTMDSDEEWVLVDSKRQTTT